MLGWKGQWHGSIARMGPEDREGPQALLCNGRASEGLDSCNTFSAGPVDSRSRVLFGLRRRDTCDDVLCAAYDFENPGIPRGCLACRTGWSGNPRGHRDDPARYDPGHDDPGHDAPGHDAPGPCATSDA